MRNWIAPVCVAVLVVAWAGCRAEVPRNAPQAPARIALTRFASVGEATNRFHIWFLSRGGDLFMYDGGYDDVLGSRFHHPASPVVTREGPRGALNRHGLAAVGWVRLDGTLATSRERVYVIGDQDGRLYEFGQRSDGAWTAWRQGIVETDAGPRSYSAAGPVAASLLRVGREIRVAVVFVDVDGNAFGCLPGPLFPVPDGPGDSAGHYNFSCQQITVPAPLASDGDLVALHPGGAAPLAALFVGRTAATALAVGIWFDDSGWHARSLGAPATGLREGLAGVAEVDESIKEAIVFSTTASGGRGVPVELRWVAPFATSSASWRTLDYPASFVGASGRRGELSAAWAPQRGAIQLAALDESPDPDILPSQGLQRATIPWSPPGLPGTPTWARDVAPGDVTGLGGVLLTEYLSFLPSGGQQFDFTLANGRIGSMGYLFLDEHRVDWETGDEWYEWKNLGSAQAKMVEVTGLTSPHNELFMSEYDGTVALFRGRVLAASIVRDNPFYVTTSYSRSDGMTWDFQDAPLPLPPGNVPGPVVHFQTDPTIAFDQRGRGYVMVVGGINMGVDPDTGRDAQVCQPRIGGPPGYMSRFGIYFYQYDVDGAGHVVTSPPYFLVNRNFAFAQGLLDHPWLATFNPPDGSPSTFYATWSAGAALVQATSFGEDDWIDWTADPPFYQVKIPTGPDGAFEDLTGAPVAVVVRSPGDRPRVILYTIGGEFCELADTPDAYDWKCSLYQSLRDVVAPALSSRSIRFRYADPVYSDASGDPVLRAILQVAQPLTIAASRRAADEIYYVFSAMGPGCGYTDNRFHRVYFTRGVRSGDGTGWTWDPPIAVSPPRPAGSCGHDFDPEVATTDDGTVFVWWRAAEGVYDPGTGGNGELVDPDLVYYAAMLQPVARGSAEYKLVSYVRMSDVVGRLQNLPVHCGRPISPDDEDLPTHFAGEYDAYLGGHTHVHIPFSVPRWSEGWYTSQMFHSVVTPFNF